MFKRMSNDQAQRVYDVSTNAGASVAHAVQITIEIGSNVGSNTVDTTRLGVKGFLDGFKSEWHKPRQLLIESK